MGVLPGAPCWNLVQHGIAVTGHPHIRGWPGLRHNTGRAATVSCPGGSVRLAAVAAEHLASEWRMATRGQRQGWYQLRTARR